MDHAKAKAAVDVDAARSFANASSLELDGLANFFRQAIVDCEWEIARAKSSAAAYQSALDAIEDAKRTRAGKPPARL